MVNIQILLPGRISISVFFFLTASNEVQYIHSYKSADTILFVESRVLGYSWYLHDRGNSKVTLPWHF